MGVIIVSALMLFLDVKLPNELKGFIFYAQVDQCVHCRWNKYCNLSLSSIGGRSGVQAIHCGSN